MRRSLIALAPALLFSGCPFLPGPGPDPEPAALEITSPGVQWTCEPECVGTGGLIIRNETANETSGPPEFTSTLPQNVTFSFDPQDPSACNGVDVLPANGECAIQIRIEGAPGGQFVTITADAGSHVGETQIFVII